MNIDRRSRELLDEFRRGGSVSTAADYAERKPMTIDIPEGYESLGLALGEAVAQASRGKGADRHAEKGEPFSDQLIMSIPKRLGEGGECFCLGQALKKICESRRLPPGRARAELLGAINYLAAAWGLLGGFADVAGPAPEGRAFRKPEGGVVHLSAPEDFAFDEARMRESMPGIVPQEEDAAAPLFVEGERVKYAVQGKWEPAVYVGVDPEGKHVVRAGYSHIHLDASLVRKA